MAPTTHSEDIYSVLSRFTQWSGKRTETSGDSEGIREIPLEEALRQLGSRRTTQAGPRMAAPAGQARAVVQSPASPPVAPGGNRAAQPQEDPRQKLKPNVRPRRCGNSANKAISRPPDTPPQAPFRAALEKSLAASEATAGKSAERDLRITVRFSKAEGEAIHERAAQRGWTVSAYLRHCALGCEPPAPAAQTAAPDVATAPVPATSLWMSAAPPLTTSPQFEAANESGWLGRLRQRFFASADDPEE